MAYRFVAVYCIHFIILLCVTLKLLLLVSFLSFVPLLTLNPSEDTESKSWTQYVASLGFGVRRGNTKSLKAYMVGFGSKKEIPHESQWQHSCRPRPTRDFGTENSFSQPLPPFLASSKYPVGTMEAMETTPPPEFEEIANF